MTVSQLIAHVYNKRPWSTIGARLLKTELLRNDKNRKNESFKIQLVILVLRISSKRIFDKWPIYIKNPFCPKIKKDATIQILFYETQLIRKLTYSFHSHLILDQSPDVLYSSGISLRGFGPGRSMKKFQKFDDILMWTGCIFSQQSSSW